MTIQTALWGLASIRCLTVHQISCRAKTNPQQYCRRTLSSRDCPRQRSCLFNMLRDIFFLFPFLNLLQTGLPKYCKAPRHGNNQGAITQECLWASGSCLSAPPLFSICHSHPWMQGKMPPSQISPECFLSGTQIYLPQIFGLLYLTRPYSLSPGQNGVGIRIIWQSLHLASSSFCSSSWCNLFYDRGIGHLFFSRACGLLCHGFFHCHMCSGVLFYKSVFHHHLIPYFALCQWFLSQKRSLLLHMTSGLNRLTADKFVNVFRWVHTTETHLNNHCR